MPERIGTIEALQVHRAPLRRKATYDPAPILRVDRGAISARGFIGLSCEGWVLDTHHSDHPEVRGRGLRPLSMGLTSHYERMSARFPNVAPGVGGENILVRSEGRWTEEALTAGVVIATADGSEISLPGAVPAQPCLEFTSHLLGLSERADRDDVLDEMDFLGGGMRGFLLDAGRIRAPQVFSVGDEVWTVA